MKIVNLSEASRLDEVVNLVVDVLKAGGIVLAPSDTCYGFMADAFNENARVNLCELKNMPQDKPVSIVCADLKMLFEFGNFDETARDVVAQFLPGKLTMIIPSLDERFGDFVGLRLPDHFLMKEVAKKMGHPYFTTSANIHGMPAQYSLEFIRAQFGDVFNKIDLVVDAGILSEVKPSTVIRIENGDIEVVRDGGLGKFFENY